MTSRPANFFAHEYQTVMAARLMARDNRDANVLAITARLIEAIRKGTYLNNEHRADVLTVREFVAG